MRAARSRFLPVSYLVIAVLSSLFNPVVAWSPAGSLRVRDGHAMNHEDEVPPIKQAINLKLRRQSSIFGNGTTIGSNSTIQDALDLVAAAQAESRARNKRLLSNPRTNKHTFHVVPPTPGGPTSDPDPRTGTGVNETVSDAAALVAEALATNGSIISSRRLHGPAAHQSRQTSSYWMAQMTQNGRSPFVTDPNYKVGNMFPTRRSAQNWVATNFHSHDTRCGET